MYSRKKDLIKQRDAKLATMTEDNKDQMRKEIESLHSEIQQANELCEIVDLFYKSITLTENGSSSEDHASKTAASA